MDGWICSCPYHFYTYFKIPTQHHMSAQRPLVTHKSVIFCLFSLLICFIYSIDSLSCRIYTQCCKWVKMKCPTVHVWVSACWCCRSMTFWLKANGGKKKELSPAAVTQSCPNELFEGHCAPRLQGGRWQRLDVSTMPSDDMTFPWETTVWNSMQHAPSCKYLWFCVWQSIILE